jgi:hypothetical protein
MLLGATGWEMLSMLSTRAGQSPRLSTCTCPRRYLSYTCSSLPHIQAHNRYFKSGLAA